MHKRFLPDSDWSLFLDRDGVLNKRLMDDYIKIPEDFVWIEGVLERFPFLSGLFKRIVVVTNQQGIGKSLMSESDLEKIHEKMKSDVVKVGGRIDNIYFAPQLREENSYFRKPNIGMAVKAKKDFPDIKFKKSVMVGDTYNDMLFGKRMNMKTVLIAEQDNKLSSEVNLVDFCFPSLIELADFLKEIKK